nr:phosphatidylinositol 3,4,5-trisphosphate-dependent Rac exchanger 1 protein-like isoform X2 [Camelus dromedarius]
MRIFSLTTKDCGRLTALSSVVKTTFHYEFCHLRHRAGEHWPEDRLQPGGARILQGLRGGYCGCHLNSMSNTQHCISTMPAASWKCLPAVDGDSQSQGPNDSIFEPASGVLSQEDRGLSSSRRTMRSRTPTCSSSPNWMCL